jgi:hypothetical protein
VDEQNVHLLFPRSCYGCENAMFGPRGTYCAEYDETILSETAAAEDCEGYTPV